MNQIYGKYDTYVANIMPIPGRNVMQNLAIFQLPLCLKTNIACIS